MTKNVQLTNLGGSVSARAGSVSGSSIALRAQVPGPALEMTGCAASQDAVAGFIDTVKDIEGVTRVAVPTSQIGSSETAEAGTACPKNTAQFQLVAGFDAAPVPLVETGGEVAVEAPVESESTSTESTESESTSTETASTGSTEESPAD